MTATDHPLKHSWTLYYDTMQKSAAANAPDTSKGGGGDVSGGNPKESRWSENMQKIFEFNTVEDFWRMYNNVKTPAILESGASYRLFKSDVAPTWEDPANAKGGRWTIVIAQQPGRKQLIDKHWLHSVLGLIGERFDTDGQQLCGVVISVRRTQDKISFWTRDATDTNAVKTIGRRIKSELDLPDNVRIQYQAHFEKGYV